MLKAGQKQEIAFPLEAVRALRDALTQELGPEHAARVLRNAGEPAGRALVRRMAGSPEEADLAALRSMPRTAFWRAFSDALASRGWGRLEHAPGSEGSDGADALRSADWAEVAKIDSTSTPMCHFTSGLLTGMLSEVAGGDIAVSEVECRSRGDEQCVFLYGAPGRIEGTRR